MTAKLVGDLMVKLVHAVPPDTPVIKVASDMDGLNIGAVIVLKDGKPAGIFTERDLLRRVVVTGKDPRQTPVSEVMTPKLMGVAPGATLEVAAILMAKRGFRHLPVMENGALVGILSMRDVLGALAVDRGVRSSGESQIRTLRPGDSQIRPG